MEPFFHNIAQNQALLELIHQAIEQAGGRISFVRFMELSLYTPELGYYSSSVPKFGKSGDFVTASEISPLFARCMARQFEQILKTLGSGDILEIGAGSGVFAKDVLLALEATDCLPKQYFIWEKSLALRERQQAMLSVSCPHLISRIVWLDALPTKNFTGIVFANEVMDAMPVHLFRIQHQQVLERYVTWRDGSLAWEVSPSDNTTLVQAVQALDLMDGYESEINLGLSDWVQSLSTLLHRGAILLADYGYGRREYYHQQRTEGTLMCFYQHQQHSDPFQWVGLQDMTAHVDFTRVVENAVESGLELAGYTTQAAFLLACGLLELAEALNGSETDYYQQNQAIKRLTLPSQMGELVKVMGLSRSLPLSWLGFSLHDRRHDL